MTMMIPFNPAVIYSFLFSRSCTKTPPQGKSSMILPIIWILSSSLFWQHFPYILLFHLFHSTSEFILYYIVWAVRKQKWCLLQLWSPTMPTQSLVHGDILHSFVDLNWIVNSADPQFCSTWCPTAFLPWPLPWSRITGVVWGESALVYQDWNEWEGVRSGG